MEHSNEEQLKQQIVDGLKNLSPIGGLFDSVIQYTTFEDLDNFIVNLTKEQAMYCLKQALIACHVRGSFTMEETEAVSKSLRILNS